MCVYIYIYIGRDRVFLIRGRFGEVSKTFETCKELRVEHGQTSCHFRPPFLGTPLLPSRPI